MTRQRASNWGGRRPGAGRPKKSPEIVAHTARAAHSKLHPVLITLRLLPGLGSLRTGRVFRSLSDAFALGRERFGFRLVHYSVQRDHVHLLVEADSRRALTRGMQGLSIRLARAFNGLQQRTGKVFMERYREQHLRTALAVRQALVEVLLGGRKLELERGKSLPRGWLDPCSSAAEFDGFEFAAALPAGHPRARATTAEPRTDLLRAAWKRHGLLRVDEVPKGTAAARSPAENPSSLKLPLPSSTVSTRSRSLR